jgi:hypothetical protein
MSPSRTRRLTTDGGPGERGNAVTTLSRDALWAALDRYSALESVFASDRVCLASSYGELSELRGRDGFIFHWTGSELPRWLWPLSILISSRRCVVELTRPGSVTAFARAADLMFTVTFISFSRSLLPAVLAQIRADGWRACLTVAHEDATYAELYFNCDDDFRDGVLIFGRGNRDCPPDIGQYFNDIDDLEPPWLSDRAAGT